MGNPVILIIDDESVILNAVERDLRMKYGRDYRIAKFDSGSKALDYLKQLQQRNEIVALFLTDQRMPNMTGVEFLDQAREFYPDAKKVLLTAYADTEAVITSINKVQLDYYLMKPWDPPRENLYPVMDDLLEEWRSSAKLPYEGIRLSGTLWSPRSHEIKDFLAHHQIAYQWLDVENDPKTRALVEAQSQGTLKLPVIFFPDGTVLVEPEVSQLAEKSGFQTKASLPFYDRVIIGAGPAVLASLPVKVDVVQVFRRPEDVPPVAEGAIRIGARVLWMQKGIVNTEAAKRAEIAGLKVVMDRCMMETHERLLGGIFSFQE
jgi:thioredoxin reductase (NADPH)